MYCDKCIIYWFYWVKRDKPPLWPLYLSHFKQILMHRVGQTGFFFIMHSLIVKITQRSWDWLMVVGSGYPHSSTSRGVRWMYRETKTSYSLLSQGVTWTLAKHHLQSSSCTCPSRNQQPALFVRHILMSVVIRSMFVSRMFPFSHLF